MPECILHIGTRKTGSSSLQSTLFEARDTLQADHDITYYDGALNHSSQCPAFMAEPMAYEQFKFMGISHVADARRYARDCLAQLDASIAGLQTNRFVLSGEGFSVMKSGDVETLAGFLRQRFQKIRIIVYVRDPFGYAISEAQELIKRGATWDDIRRDSGTGDDPDWNSADIGAPYRFWIEKYQNAFGPEAVEIRPFDRGKLIDGDLVNDFLQGVLNLPAGAVEIQRKNESISPQACYILAALNASVPLFIGNHLNPDRAKSLSEQFERIPGTGKLAHPVLDMDMIARTTANDVQWLCATTNGQINFDLTPPTPKTETLMDFDVDAIGQLLNEQTLERERLAANARLFRELWLLGSNLSTDMTPLENQIKHSRDPEFLRRAAASLNKAGLAELSKAARQKAHKLDPKRAA